MNNKEIDNKQKANKDIMLEYHNWYEFSENMKTFHIAKFGDAGDEIVTEERIIWT